MESITITLDLPPRELSPNVKSHWAVKARAVRAYRNAAKFAVLEKGLPASAPWGRCRVRTAFYFAVQRGRDGDNLLASMKAAFDGIADSGLVVNDKGMIHDPPLIEVNPDIEPMVVVCVERME